MLASHAAVARDLLIADVAVVDTRTGKVTPHQDVLVHAGRIASVGSLTPSPDVERIPASAKFLAPGLWDMVTHLSWTRASALPALVANGVTAVRDEGGDLAETAVWAAAVKAGTLDGPTIFQVGPMLNGRSFNEFQYDLGTPEQARAAVRLLKFMKVDGLEVERRVSRDEYFALLAEAKLAKLPVGGKVPLEVTPAEASNAGQATIDNLETIYDGMFRTAHPGGIVEAIDEFLAAGGAADAVFGTFRQNQTAITPSVETFGASIAHNDPAAPPDKLRAFVAKSQRRPLKRLAQADLAEFAEMMPRLLTTIARLNSDGVTLLAGTDIAGDRIPGFSLHDELDVFSKAGLDPLHVLQTATLNPAVVMHRTDDYGAVEVGKIADLVLLDADPTRTVSALHRIRGVVLHGRFMDRAALDTLLQRARSEADRN